MTSWKWCTGKSLINCSCFQFCNYCFCLKLAWLDFCQVTRRVRCELERGRKPLAAFNQQPDTLSSPFPMPTHPETLPLQKCCDLGFQGTGTHISHSSELWVQMLTEEYTFSLGSEIIQRPKGLLCSGEDKGLLPEPIIVTSVPSGLLPNPIVELFLG